MYKLLLVVSLVVCQFSVGDFNARVRYPRKVNHRAVRKPEEPQRRTFISALLMAEINYLEGLLADQQSSRKPAKKPSSGKHQAQKPHKHPAKGQYQASKPEKYVSKLDPFHMIAAPDLTKEPAKETYEVKDSYEGPSDTTTKKYGELEHYNLKGYLPPVKEDSNPVTESYATPVPAPANTYQVVQAPVLNPGTFSYEAPAPAPAYSAPATTYPAPEPTYKSPEPAYAAPATTYPAPQKAYKTPEPSNYEAPAPAPSYSAPAATYQPAPAPAPAPAPSSYQQNSHPLTFFHDAQASAVHEGSQGGPGDSAASGTGEWPTVYYNTFDGSKKTLIL